MQPPQPSKAQPRRIAFIAPFGLLTKGTTVARLLPIAEALAARGHKIRVVVPPWDDPANSPDLKLSAPRYEKRGDLELVFIPTAKKPQVLHIPRALVKYALEFRPDTIYVFKPKAYSGLAALELGARRIPFLLDTDDWEGRGGYNDILPYSLPQKLLFGWQEGDLPRRAAGVTVASRTLQTQVWSFGVAPEKVVYLPNGIAPEKFAGWNTPEVAQQTAALRQKFSMEHEHKVLLAYTRFVEFAPERLPQILKLILEKLPARYRENTRLLIVGGGFYDEEKAFRQLAEKYGLTDKIVMAGRASPEELPALLRLGDVALYPFDDNLINRARCSAKFLDLIMAERPIVSEAVGELPQYLLDGKGGLLLPPGDNAKFADAAVQLLTLPPDVRAEFGRVGVRRLKTDFTWTKLVEPLDKMLQMG